MDVLPRQTADAVANMAADYLLLEHYPRPDRIRFRPFAWSEPAYTFGVSQPWAKYRAQVPAHYPLIRRCTGGGLVSHLDDWTFALVIPAGHPLYAADAMASYAAVHDALAAALQAQGQPVKLAPAPTGERPFQSPDACAQRAEPNDLVRSDDGRKVAGMLTEARLDADSVRELVFGLGLNFTGQPKDFPAEIRATAGSLEAALGEPIDINREAAAVIAALFHAWEQFEEGTWSRSFRKLWQHHDVLAGKSVRVGLRGDPVAGIVDGIDEEGSLILRTGGGRKTIVSSGEVTLRKP